MEQRPPMKKDQCKEVMRRRWHMPLIRLARAGFVATGMFVVTCAAAQDAERNAYLTRAVLAGDQLWLRNDQGQLSTIRVQGKERIPRPTSHPVADICAFDGEVIAVSVEDDGTWVVFRPGKADEERLSIKAPAPGDAPLLDCRGGAISIIGSQRLSTLDRAGAGAAARTVALSKPVVRGLTTTVYGDAGHLYVGTGNGEFGGGFWVVDRLTGEVIGGDDRDALARACDKATKGNCAPVNDIVGIPWKSGCVALAVGLQHMMSNGALVELCGRSFHPMYQSAYTSAWLRSMLHGRSSEETVPFYALLAKPSSLLAAGLDSLYEIGPHGAIAIVPYPTFTRIGGVDVSFERADVILVRTAAVQRKAASSETLLMVPR